MNENEIGSKLVNILYENSNTNYDICAENLIKVFSFLERNVEKLDSKNFKLILESIKVIKFSTKKKFYFPDF